MVTAWVRSFAPSLESMLEMWFFTVSPDGEPVRDLLIGIACANQTKHIYFARTQMIVGSVVSQHRRNLGWYSLAPGMDGSNSLQQFCADIPFQQVPPCTRLDRV